MKVGAAVIFFNAKAELKRCLSSLSSFDTVFAIDGKFTGYPGRIHKSTDGSRELAKSYPNVLLYDYVGTQSEKRNFYLKLARSAGLDYLLYLDSDAWVYKLDWKEFLDCLQGHLNDGYIYYGVDYVYDNQEPYSWAYIYKPKGLSYTPIHNVLRHTCGMHFMIPWIPDGPHIVGIGLVHNQVLRTAKRNSYRTTYKLFKRDAESKARVEMGYPPYKENQL